MSTPQTPDLVTLLVDAGRELSTVTVLFHTALATHFGLSATDWKCAEWIYREELTAGQLAVRTGLTTGAITGVIDRLEKAGFARRVADPNDRRRVILQPVYSHMAELERLFTPLVGGMMAMAATYSDDEQRLILGYLQRCIEITEQAKAAISA
jgi:DNA-binding MarR family transcriptional regulator